MIEAYKKIDDRIQDMHSECENRGITMMLMSDHAQAKVEDTIDIVGKISELGIDENEISYFVEAPMVRFWFHSDSAREKMLEYLSGNEKGTLRPKALVIALTRNRGKGLIDRGPPSDRLRNW